MDDEYDILNSKQIHESERKRHGEVGKYVDTISHRLILYQCILGGACAIIFEDKITRHCYRVMLEILYDLCNNKKRRR